MPMLEWICPKCGRFEKIEPRYTEDPEPCPVCGQESPKAVSVPAPMVWGKGGGFA